LQYFFLCVGHLQHTPKFSQVAQGLLWRPHDPLSFRQRVAEGNQQFAIAAALEKANGKLSQVMC
jgi:hypothetical protein